jgi:hypothetical protein
VQPFSNLQDILERLEVFELPRVAIIANPFGTYYDKDEHERLAIGFLPNSFQKLLISRLMCRHAGGYKRHLRTRRATSQLDASRTSFSRRLRRGVVAWV